VHLDHLFFILFLHSERGGLTSPDTEANSILTASEMPEVNEGNLAGSSGSNSKDSKASSRVLSIRYCDKQQFINIT